MTIRSLPPYPNDPTATIDPRAGRRARRFAAHGPRARVEGMTLVEIMIVIIIMALIAAAVGIAVLPQLKKARIKTTHTDAQSVRSAVTIYLSENPDKDCPTMDDLVQGQYLDKTKRTADAWNTPFKIECDGDNVAVVSAGPDKQFGTEDDIE
ncbi:MAG: type II secretion system protein GspG [Myxococcales bacterium]|nr:type II secretion system protein GspG [Myxococcales bacterium]